MEFLTCGVNARDEQARVIGEDAIPGFVLREGVIGGLAESLLCGRWGCEESSVGDGAKCVAGVVACGAGFCQVAAEGDEPWRKARVGVGEARACGGGCV